MASHTNGAAEPWSPRQRPKRGKLYPSGFKHHPDSEITAAEVWAAYEAERSLRRTVQKTGIPMWVVRSVLADDKERLANMIRARLEDVCTRWENREERAGRLLDTAMVLVQGLFDEIIAAAAEGRVTRIVDSTGFALPVPDAIQSIVTNRTMGQALAVCQTAYENVLRFRTSGTAGGLFSADEKDRPNPGQKPFEEMNDSELVQYALHSAMPIPDYLRRKLYDEHGTSDPDKLPPHED